MTTIDVSEYITRMVREILDDMARGIVPETVSSYSELHDYVDANMYGHLDEWESAPMDVLVDAFNAASNVVDRWLRNRKAGI